MSRSYYTRYLRPTDTRGSRIAVYGAPSPYIEPYDHSAKSAHQAAVERATGKKVEFVHETKTGKFFREVTS